MTLQDVVEAIAAQRALLPEQHALLVAISGIDGSGKGYLTEKMADMLFQRQFRVATINLDGWLNLPDKRFSSTNPAEHFYHHAFRFDELFSQLVSPLRAGRSVSIDADYAEETATTYRTHQYLFEDVDVILLEGIYLLKCQFQSYYDFSIWIECSFETALERAIARSQEELSQEETIQAYQTIYFPAQEIHFERDHPIPAATACINNDPRLE
jgi:uridine kinase